LIPANLAVGLFFVLSGYALTRGWEGRLGVFFARRFLRLWPVYAVCLTAGYIIAGASPVWSEFLWYPLIGPDDQPAINPPVWSLFLEVWAMPFMPLIVWSSCNRVRAVGCTAATMLAASVVSQASILGLFVAGAYFARDNFRSRLLESAVPQWLGRISYSLYLSHALVLKVFVRAFGPWGGLLALPIALGVGWLTWRCIENPSIWASRKIGRAKIFKLPSAAA
jgi:peptidoglycan/LPS O-acetylase OafA/YrhL